MNGEITEKKGLLKRLYEEKRDAVIWAAAFFILGAAFSNSGINNSYSPFALSLVSSAGGVYSLFALVGATIGFLLSGITENVVRFVASALIISAVKWAFAAFFESEQKWALPTSAGAVNLAVSAVLLITGESSVYDILLIVSESVLCGGAAFFMLKVLDIIKSKNRIETAENIISVSVSLALLLLSLSKIEIGMASLGRLIGNFAVLSMTYCFGIFGGTVSAVCIGTTLSLSGGDGGFSAMAFSISSLLAGLFSKISRYALSLSYLLCITLSVAVVSVKAEELYFLYEALVSSALFLLTPDKFFKKIKYAFPNTSGEIYPNKYLSARLNFVSSALSETSQSLCEMATLLEKKESLDINSVYSSTADRVCRRCPRKLGCWEENYNDTMDSFNHMTPALKRQGRIEPQNIPDRLRQSCAKLPQLISEINGSYQKALNLKQAALRSRQIKEVVTGQFSGISRLLCEMSQELSLTHCDIEKEHRIGAELLNRGIEVRDVSCPVDRFGRKMVEFYCLSEDTEEILNSGAEEIISELCHTAFEKVKVVKTGELAKLCFSQKAPYSIKTASCQKNAEGEKLCGDSFLTCEMQNGFSAVILSDGMGTGESAALDSKVTVSLISRFLSLGFTVENSVSLVNSALMLKSEDETLATLDTAVFDLYSGSVSIKKSGAAPSFIKRSKRISKIEIGSLPLGILGDVKVRSAELKLSRGDILVMCSDGLCTLTDNEIERIIKRNDNIEIIAKTLCEAAANKAGETKRDDITVLVTKIS